MSVWVQMLQGDSGQGSASNAGFLLSVVALSICTVYAAAFGSETAFLGSATILAGQTALTKTMNKVSEASVLRSKERPAPIPAAPSAPPQGVNINVGAQANEKSSINRKETP
jgi:hypothetical protein